MPDAIGQAGICRGRWLRYDMTMDPLRREAAVSPPDEDEPSGKGFPLWRRFGFAIAGVAHALRRERSFRTQLLAALFVGASIVVLRPPLFWTALLTVMVALVLAFELFNTALEELLDGLHPERAEFVRRAKDCAAGAVLLLSAGAVVVFVLMLVDMGSRS